MGAIYDAAKRLHDAGTPVEIILDTIRDMEALKPQRKAPSAQTRATRLPLDWQAPAEWIEWALAEFPGMPREYAVQQAATFKDYWTGRGKPMVDWQATWRNWMRKAVEDRRAHQQRRGVQQSVTERRRAAIAERYEVDDAAGTRRERPSASGAVRGLPLLESH